jgi:peptidyl-prolyl cis-trans isomerase D
MAMLITRFHKLIQSKVVWYIILGVIVVSFVGFFTPTMRAANRQPKSRPAGELFGKKVSMDEYHRAFSHTYMWYILSSGRMIPMSDELNAALRSEAWNRVAILRKAREAKVVVTDKEVVQQMQSLPLFRSPQNGAFDVNVYKAVLQQLGMTSAQAEDLFREQIIIYKEMYRPTQAALISPFELKKAYQLYTDRFVLDYAVLPRAQVEKTVKVSREDAQALFDANPAAFTMPEKVRVSYVEFPVSQFVAKAEVPEGIALQFYNRNIEKYRIETTNTEAAVEYKPFESVEGDITAQLKKIFAVKLAAEKASEFVADVTPKSDGAKPDFKGAAAAAGLTVKSMPAFGMRDELPGIDTNAPFTQAAFTLEDNNYSSFSDAVIGRDSVYVLSLEKRYPAFVPEFSAVEKEVTAAAREQAVSKALAERAVEVEKAVSASLEKGADFKTAIKPFGLAVKTTPEFDLSTELKDKYAETLVQGCLNVQQGGLCKPAAVDGGVLLAYVASRKSTDMELGLPVVRDELVYSLSRSRAQRLAAAWQQSLLIEGDFKDLLHQASE